MYMHLSPSVPARISAHLILMMVVLFTLIPHALAEDKSPKKEFIEGWVVDPEGKPVESAVVLAVEAQKHDLSEGRTKVKQTKPSERVVAEAWTDADGRFRIEVEGEPPFTLRADAEGLAATQMSRIDPGEVGAVVLTEGWTISGKVLSKLSGEPISGAELLCERTFKSGMGSKEFRHHFQYGATTNEAGEFTIPALEAAWYTITAEADGHSTEVREWSEIGMNDIAPDPFYLYLLPGVTLSGVVVDVAGSPVKEVKINVRPEKSVPAQWKRWANAKALQATTGGDGSFEIKGVPAASSYVLEARHDEYALSWTSGVELEKGRSPALRIVMRPGAEMTGRLLDDGEPYSGKVSATFVYSLPESEYSPIVGFPQKEIQLENGKIVLGHLPAGKADLKIEVPGFSPVNRKGLDIAAEQVPELGEIELDPGLRITGKVLDADGEPIADASVKAVCFSSSAGYSQESAKSSEDGSFVIGGLAEGAYSLTAKASKYAPANMESIDPGGDPVKISLEKAGRINGRVLAGDPPKPLVGFAVEAIGKQNSGMPFPVPAAARGDKRGDYRDISGRFAMTGLAPGSYSIKIEAGKFITARREGIEVTASGTVDIGDVLLERGATLNGIVTEAGTGKPVGGASVRIAAAGLLDFSGFPMRGQEAAQLTEPDGRFILAGLAPGSIEIVVEHESYSPGAKQVEIVSGIPPADVTIALSMGGVIEGTLRDSKGEPVSGGIVMVMRGFTMSADGTLTTDEIGRFRKERLAPGSYRVMGMPRPEQGASFEELMGGLKVATVEVSDGKTVTVNLPPDSAQITVTGVVRQRGKPVAASMFWVRTSGGGTMVDDMAMASSDESGAYRVQLTSPGEYRVAIRTESFDAADMVTPGLSLKVDIPDDQQVTHDIVIPDAAITGMVLDGDSGLPLQGVHVSAVDSKEDEPPAMAMMAGSARTDGEGRYELAGLAEGKYTIGFVKEKYGTETLGPVSLQDNESEEGLNVSLFPAVAYRLKIVGENGEPIASALVTVLSLPVPTSGGGLVTFTDQNGVAELTSLPEGSHELGVVTRGLAPRLVQSLPAGGEEEEMQSVTLRRGAPLIVTLIDAEERPVSTAAIRISDASGADLTSLFQIIAQLTGRGLVTGPDGTLEISNIEAGRYEVEARWQERVVSGKVNIKETGTNRIELKLK